MQQKQKFNNKGDLSFCFGKNATFMKAANAHLFFNLEDFIQMVNSHDSQIAMVDMATQTQWFDEKVIFKMFSEIKNETTLDMISKQIQAYYSYYLSCEDMHLGTFNEEYIFVPHCADFPKRLSQIKKRLVAQRSAWSNLYATQNEFFEYLNQCKSDTKKIAKSDKESTENIPVNLKNMICLSVEHHVNVFVRFIREVSDWVSKHKSQYWDICYLEMMSVGLIKMGTTRKGFSRLMEYFTTINQATIYNNMMKCYTHGKSIDWYRKQPDSSEAQIIGSEVRGIINKNGILR